MARWAGVGSPQNSIQPKLAVGKPLPKASCGLEVSLAALESYKLLTRALKQVVLNQLTAHLSENKSLLEFTVQAIKLHASDKNIPQNNAWDPATWQASGTRSSENYLWI